jgi:hypothetical protein
MLWSNESLSALYLYKYDWSKHIWSSYKTFWEEKEYQACLFRFLLAFLWSINLYLGTRQVPFCNRRLMIWYKTSLVRDFYGQIQNRKIGNISFHDQFWERSIMFTWVGRKKGGVDEKLQSWFIIKWKLTQNSINQSLVWSKQRTRLDTLSLPLWHGQQGNKARFGEEGQYEAWETFLMSEMKIYTTQKCLQLYSLVTFIPDMVCSKEYITHYPKKIKSKITCALYSGYYWALHIMLFLYIYLLKVGPNHWPE